MLPRSWPYSAAPLPQYGPAVASCCAQNTANAPAAATPPPSPCHLVICTAAAALRPRWLPHLIAVLSLPKPAAAAAAWLSQSACHQSKPGIIYIIHRQRHRAGKKVVPPKKLWGNHLQPKMSPQCMRISKKPHYWKCRRAQQCRPVECCSAAER